MVKCNAAFKAKADDAIDIPLVTALVMPAEQTLMVRDYCSNAYDD